MGRKINTYNSTIEWLPQSPDLSPLDFYFWDCSKEKIYRTIPTNQLDLQQRIFNACNTLTPTMLMNVHEEMFLQLQNCIVVNGMLFENIQH